MLIWRRKWLPVGKRLSIFQILSQALFAKVVRLALFEKALFAKLSRLSFVAREIISDRYSGVWK